MFFAENDRGAVVIKGSKSIAGEIFATLLEMYFGVYVPKFRVIRTESEEGIAMLSALKKADPTWRVVSNLFDLSYVLVKEFVHVDLFISLLLIPRYITYFLTLFNFSISLFIYILTLKLNLFYFSHRERISLNFLTKMQARSLDLGGN